MANEAVEKAVDGLIAAGRVQREMRDEYIRHLEQNLGSELLRGADYTKKTQALADERRQAEQWLNQERQKVEAERQQLRQWHGQVNGQLEDYDRVTEDMRRMAAENAAYKQALTDYQIIDKVAIPSISDPSSRPATRTTPQPTVRPQIEPSQTFLTREAGAGALRDMALLHGKVNRINAQHMKLYGEPLEEDLYSHYMETGQDPEEYWKVKYNVEGRRNELAQKQRESEMAAMREQIRAEVMQQITSDPSRVIGGQGQHPVGGLTPVMERYAQSRALANNPVQDKENKNPDFVPPEMKPDIATSRDRVNRAANMFATNFDTLGRPTTEQGRELARKYSE